MEAIRSLIEMAALGIESLAVGVILIATVHGTVSYLLHLRDKIPDAYERYKDPAGQGAAARAGTAGGGRHHQDRGARTDAGQTCVILAVLVVVRTFLSWSLVVEIEGHWPWKT